MGADEHFLTLGLPVGPATPIALEKAYRTLQRNWFLKQYVPETAVEARQSLAKLDEAFRVLRDPRRQSALLREAAAKPVPRPPLAEDPPIFAWPNSAKRSEAPLVNRPIVVRELMIAAEKIVARQGRALAEAEKSSLARIAFERGLDFTDAEQIVDQIARRVADDNNLPVSAVY